MRFAGPVPAALVGEVARWRRADFEGFVAREVELVLSDETLSAGATRVVRRCRLGTDRPR